MKRSRKPGSWWHTLPGMLTAVAGILGAIATLIATLNQNGLLPGHPQPAPPEPTPVAPTPTPELRAATPEPRVPAAETRDPQDVAYENSLIGRWTITGKLPDGGVWQAATTYTRDGRFVTSGPVRYWNGTVMVTLGGTWFVKEGSLHYTIESGNNPQIPIGLKNANKIISLSRDEFIYDDSFFNVRSVARRS